VRPWLDPSVGEKVAAQLEDWRDDPTFFGDLRITRADDGTYRYEWDAALRLDRIVLVAPTRETGRMAFDRPSGLG
jgi:hypothetical protein